MFGLTRWNSFDDVFNFQREVDVSSTSSGAICRPALLPVRHPRSK
jgi:hypothetical protein